jgi:hypothetical protein
MRSFQIRPCSRRFLLPAAALVVALAPLAVPAAGQVPHGRIEATGTVGFNSLASGPFAGIPAGTPATLRVDIALPGIPLAPGQYENYVIQTATSSLTVGASTITFKPGGEPIGLQNAFPIADGVHLFATAMNPTYFMEFELFDGTGGNIFSSPDYETEAGYYGPALFQAIDWNVLGAGQMGISLQNVVLHPVSTQGTWLLAGPGVPGQGGVTPLLVGAGSIAAGQPVTFTLSDALPLTPVFWIVGSSPLNAPFKGGVMVPDPDLLLFGLSTNGTGGMSLSSPWPAGIPAGISLWYQVWLADPAGPAGFSASNGLRSISA